MKKFFLAVLMIIMTSGVCSAAAGTLKVVETTDTTATIKFTNILGADEGKFQIYYAMSAISAGTGEPNRIMDKNSNAFIYEGDTITYQLTGLSPQTVYTFRIEAENVDLTLFFSNLLNIKRYYKKNDILKKYKKRTINVNKNDVVLKGLGFIKTNKKYIINIYTLDEVEVFVRDSLI